MRDDPEKLRIILTWVTRLRTLLRKPEDAESGEESAEIVLRSYADFFYADGESGWFTQASLHAIAQQNVFFPTYKELLGQVRAWWEQNRPRPPALPPLESAPPDPRRWIDRWNKTRGLARGDREEGSAVPFAGRITLLRLIRSMDHEVFAFLVRVDPEAASLAEARHSDLEPAVPYDPGGVPDWCKSGPVHRPLPGDGLPPIGKAVARAGAAAARPRGQLPAKTIAAIRDADPLIAAARAWKAREDALREELRQRSKRHAESALPWNDEETDPT